MKDQAVHHSWLFTRFIKFMLLAKSTARPQSTRDARRSHVPVLELDLWAQECDQSVVVPVDIGVGDLHWYEMRSPLNVTICHCFSCSRASVVSKRQPSVWVVPVHQPPRLFHPAQRVQRRVRRSSKARIFEALSGCASKPLVRPAAR